MAASGCVVIVFAVDRTKFQSQLSNLVHKRVCNTCFMPFLVNFPAQVNAVEAVIMYVCLQIHDVLVKSTYFWLCNLI